MGVIRRSVEKIIDMSGAILLWFPWVLMVVIVWELVMRNMFGQPTLWAHEFSVMVFAALTILSGAYTLKEKAHVNMDLLYMGLSDRGKAIVDVITFPFFLLFCGVIMWFGWTFALRSFMLHECSISSWAPLLWPVKFTLPIGALLLLLQGIAKFMTDLSTVIHAAKEGKVK